MKLKKINKFINMVWLIVKIIIGIVMALAIAKYLK